VGVTARFVQNRPVRGYALKTKNGHLSTFRLPLNSVVQEDSEGEDRQKSVPPPIHAQTVVCAWIALERQVLGIFLSKPSFKTDPKGKDDLKGPLAYDFGQIVW
jgi:hypothetical protein